MKYYFEFKVTGRGEFPWDMLRHSRLFPLYTKDAMNLPVDPNRRDPRTIRLGGYGNSTVEADNAMARFASFLWAAELTLEERL